MFEHYQENKKKYRYIITGILIIMFLFLKPCSMYQYGPVIGDQKPYLFKKSNISIIKDGLSYLFEKFKKKDDTGKQGQFDEAMSKLNNLQQILVSQKLENNKDAKIQFISSLSATNLFKKTAGDIDLENLIELINTKRELKQFEKGALATEQLDGKKKLENKIKSLQGSVQLNDSRLKAAEKVVLPPVKKVDAVDSSAKLRENSFASHKLIIKRLGRLKPGNCGTKECFNSRGKDYNMVKSPVSNTHYFISDRQSVERPDKLGYLSIYQVKATPTSNKYQPKFSDLRKLELTGISGSVLGLTVYKKNGKLGLIFANKYKIYETTSTDEKTFSTPVLLIKSKRRFRDPSISKDGRLLLLAEDNHFRRSCIDILRRSSHNAQFTVKNLKQLTETEQQTGPGIFPSIIYYGNLKFILYNWGGKLLTMEIKGNRFLPPVETEGERPLKYIVNFKNIVMGSYLPTSDNYDIYRYSIKVVPAIAKKWEKITKK